MNYEGVLPVHKPAGFTSHDVVAKLRRIVGMKRIGHTGTLDPQVTGVLPLCLGRATRFVEYIQELPKQYEAELTFGHSTDTEDWTGETLEPLVRDAPGMGGAADVPEDDLGARSFAAILASGTAITIDVERPGLFQHWEGALPEPKPAMGFVNIMQPDFHLHLKAGAVAGWERQEANGIVALHARDAEGKSFGLVLRGPAAAFGEVPESHAGRG